MKILLGTKFEAHLSESLIFSCCHHGILDLWHQKSGEEKKKGKTVQGRTFSTCAGTGALTVVMKFSSFFPRSLELSRLPPPHQKRAVVTGWTGSKEIMLCPRQSWGLWGPRQLGLLPKALLTLRILWGWGCPLRKKKKRWMLRFSAFETVWHPQIHCCLFTLTFIQMRL